MINSVTMYKVVIYGLIIIGLHGFLLSFLGVIAYTPVSLVSSLLVIGATTLLAHTIFEFAYKAPANFDSSLISGLLVFLVVAPPESLTDVGWLMLATGTVIASKYVLAFKNRHIFNPVAIGLVIVGLFQFTGVTWWVSSKYFFPVMLIVGLFVLRKVKRFTLFFAYLVTSIIVVSLSAVFHEQNVTEMISQHILSWPILFLGIFMLTEPLTTPPTKGLQIVYGAIVGTFSSFPFAFPPLYSTPELALCIGNLFAYGVSMKSRLALILKERVFLAKDTYEFVFSTPEKVPYLSGQYLEWTLPHEGEDKRGMRRYFTIASSPTDPDIRLGVRYYENGSSFKKALMSLQRGEHINATSVSGDFLLPKDTNEKLLFIAGGIGITPFISMIRTLIATNDKRDIVLFYANKTEEEIAYKHVLDEAKEKIGMKVVYVLSELTAVPASWTGEKGFITEAMLHAYMIDVPERSAYISGPPGMVSAYTAMLKKAGVQTIHTDYFPGFA